MKQLLSFKPKAPVGDPGLGAQGSFLGGSGFRVYIRSPFKLSGVALPSFEGSYTVSDLEYVGGGGGVSGNPYFGKSPILGEHMPNALSPDSELARYGVLGSCRDRHSLRGLFRVGSNILDSQSSGWERHASPALKPPKT